MSVKIGDIVITNGYEEWMFTHIKRSYKWIGKVTEILDSTVARVKTIYSEEAFRIEHIESCYIKCLVPINEAIRTGIMYEDLEREEPTIRIEQGIHHIQTGTFRLANEADAVANELITQLRNNQFMDNIRNMIEGDLYGRRRNQR